MRIRAFLVALAFTATLWAQDTFQDVEARITRFTLDNGLTFVVMERHQAPVVSFYTYADVGSAQEAKGITGLAHMFEHMAFKGTTTIGTNNYSEERLAMNREDEAFIAWQQERHKIGGGDPAKLAELEKTFQAAQSAAEKFVVTNEFMQILQSAGARGINASTGADKTEYFYSLPSNALELWFYTESDRFLNPVLREFYKEAAVVREERRMRVDSNPIGRLLDEFLGVAYRAHPYGEPTIGFISDLESFNRVDARAFFAKYYRASNLTIAVVGDVDPKQVRQFAETYFGRLPKLDKPEPLRTVEPKQDSTREVILHAQAQPIFLMGYHKPSILDPDYAVYEAISSLLSEGRSSRLYENLVTKKQVAVQVGGFGDFPGSKYPGMFVFFGVTAPGKTNADVEKEMMVEIDRLKNEPVSKEELEGIKNRARAGTLSLLSSNPTMASELASWQALTGDWHNLFQHLARTNAVTAEDIQRVARNTFIDSNRSVALLELQRPPQRPQQPPAK